MSVWQQKGNDFWVNGSFTVGHCAEKNGFKLKRIIIYLTSQLAEIILSDCSSEDEDDDFLPQTSTQIDTESWLQQNDHSDENEFDEVIENITSLTGTNDERSELLHEQDQAYFESLKLDEEKEEERRLLLEKELNDVERQERLRNVRESRLLQEPDVYGFSCQ